MFKKKRKMIPMNYGGYQPTQERPPMPKMKHIIRTNADWLAGEIRMKTIEGAAALRCPYRDKASYERCVKTDCYMCKLEWLRQERPAD